MTFRQVKVPAMLGVTLLLAVGGCTSVFETAQAPLGRGLACESAMGGYYLPKSLVHMKVSAAPADTKQRGFVVEAGSFTQDWIADRQQLFCLDYLALPNSVDNITASRDQRGLLVEVTSTVTDRTPQIVDTLVKTATQAAIAAARAGQFDEAAAGDSADLQFDPFNPHELKRINAGLRRFGLCVYVEDHSFDQQAIPAEYWCSDPAQDRYVNPFNMTLAMAPVDPETRGKGILYRPNKTHNIVVRRKVDLARDRWSLYMTKRMEMPNVSPVLLLGVERAVLPNERRRSSSTTAC